MRRCLPKAGRSAVSKPAMARGWASLPIAAALIAACPEPRAGDPQIPISPNAAGRIHLVPSRASKPAPRPAAAATARVMKKGEELGGPNATGKPGDWVLENGEVVFVIEALGGGSGFAESGGNVVDAADAKLRKDELGQLFTYFGTFPRQAVYGSLEPGKEPGGASLVARGRELHEPTVEVETIYRLAPGDRALLIETTLANRGAAPVKLGLGDAIQWGGAEKFAPGKAVGFTGPSSGPFVGGIGRFTSYAITSAEGEIAAISGSVWTDTEQKKEVVIEPGASATYERVFVVGERGDAASVVSELTKASGGTVGSLEIALVDAEGKPVAVAPGAKVVLSAPSGQEIMSVVSTGGSIFRGEVPPGSWLVSFAPSAGRRGDGKKVAALVKPDAVARATLAVSDPAWIAPTCDDHGAGAALPAQSWSSYCKITVEGLEGTPTPSFGPPHATPAARNQIFATKPVTEPVPIAPGKYRLTFTRGPEHDAPQVEITLGPGEKKEPRATPRRVVDTRGYLATDFHQHSMLSADAPVAIADRVRSNVIEGVEVAVASEHNFVADLAPVVKELGFARSLVAIAGDEITTDADKNAWGHANVFPLVPKPGAPRGGALSFMGRTPRDVFDEARRLPGRPLVQINHPRSGSNGYFDRTGFDPKIGVGTIPGYDAAFDAIEVWNGRSVEARARVLEDFLALLRTGHPVTPIGDTDTHGIVGQEAGYPRTYVRVAKDDALDAWDDARTADLIRGVRGLRDVVLTNGPFVMVNANGAPIGGVARAKGGAVRVEVRVQSAPFVVVEKVEVRLARDGKKIDAPLSPKGEASISVNVAKDDALVVIASGTKPMRPMLSGDDREIAPWAMTGAVWIDADGDGRSLGR